MSTTLTFNRGGDFGWTMNWKNDDLTPFDLTGYTIEAYEPHPRIAGHITLTVTDAVNGVVTCAVAWQNDMPSGRVMNFIPRAIQGSTEVPIGKFWINIQ